MADIIDIQDAIRKKQETRLTLLKKELDETLNDIEYDMEKEINRYVIPNNNEYYKLSKDDNNISEQSVLNIMLTALDMLVKLNMKHAALDVENVITRLKNNSY
jgi:hypothetical protein